MKCFCAPRRSMALSLLLAAFLLSLPAVLQAQSVQDGNAISNGTDLKFHKFQPAVPPERAVAAPITQADSVALTQQQILALEQDKASRTPAQQKIDSNVLYTIRMLAGKPAATGVASLNTGIDVDDNNNLIVDITANVTDRLVKQLNDAGALIWYSNARFHSIRAVVPAAQIESIAASPDVTFIVPKVQSMTSSTPRLHADPLLRPSFNQRAARIKKLLAAALQAKAAGAITNGTGQGSVTTQGDATHRAFDARGAFAVNGAGLKIGVLSDSVNATGALTLAQASGDMPPTCPAGPPCFTLLQDAAGGTDEGLAMLEIIFDMAPGANLFFATANISEASFAQNILNLRAAGCDIIVDDVGYLDEPVFQDGIVTQAVNSVTANGALYFSAAGNEGNVDSNTAGYFEGDFNDAGSPAFNFPGGTKNGTIQNFGTVATPVNGDIITAAGFGYILNWADPQGASTNDYDLFLVSSTGVIKASSTNIQNGTQNPFEFINPPALAAGDRLVVFKTASSAPVFFAINTFRGTLTVVTPGQIFGHSAASATGFYSVAATPAAGAIGPGSPTGPFPDPFSAGNSVELFTSDGPRRIFFNVDGTAITPGNFTSTGGLVRAKPDITGADGVSTTLPPGSGLNPFFGTSAAAPAAASVAALVKSANPALTQDQIRTALTSTAIDIMGTGNDRDSGAGIVMAWEAINSLGIVGTANPELGTVVAVENPGNGNGIIEAGEGAKLTIQLSNKSGVVDATAISATLTSSTPGVTVTLPGTSTYPDLAAGTGVANNATPFTFTLASNSACALSIDFTLTVSYTGGPQRVLTFSVPTGLVTLTNNLGTPVNSIPGVTIATGQQTNRLNRNGTASACGTQKLFPGTVITTGTRTFDSYSFTACKSACLTPTLSSGNGVNMFEVAYAGTFDPANIATNYAGDPGLSGSLQTFGVTTTAATNYTIVVNDVPGTATGSSYTLQFPACFLNCTINQVPVAKVQNVTVAAATPGGSANASIDAGSFDPDGDAITITQTPAGPYPVGTTTVLLTVTDTKGATAQASAVVTVTNPAGIAPPSIAKIFTPATIALNATTSLTFTITNPASNTVSLTGVAFTDTLPTGLTVASSTSTVCGGTLTTTAPTGIALSDATIAANGQCQFSLTVTGAAAGAYTNTTSAVTSTNGGTGNTATANLTVTAPAPTITNTFGAASILVNTSTSLTFSIQNPNTSLGLTGVAFTDALPAGLVVSTPSGLTSSCGGTTTAAAGSASIALVGGTLAANASCTISVNVTGVAVGVDSNTTSAISSNESGAGNTSNTATIAILGPPAITKAFGAASINLNATTSLTFTVSNPNSTVALTGVGFGDTLPTGLAVAKPNGLTGACGTGTITTGSVSGASVVNLANGTIPADR